MPQPVGIGREPSGLFVRGAGSRYPAHPYFALLLIIPPYILPPLSTEANVYLPYRPIPRERSAHRDSNLVLPTLASSTSSRPHPLSSLPLQPPSAGLLTYMAFLSQRRRGDIREVKRVVREF
jgi:hypothetical protein